MLKSKIYSNTKLVGTICFYLTVSAYAQTEKAILLYKNGQINQAKRIIDSLSFYLENENDAEMWYTKGLIYETIHLSKDSLIKSLAPHALYEAYMAYQKVLTAKKNIRYQPMARKQLDSTVAVHVYNEAIWLEKMNRSRSAANYFDIYTQIKSQDTSGYTHLAYNCIQAKNYKDAIIILHTCIDKLKYTPHWVLKTLALLYLHEEKNFFHAIEITKLGQRIYPQDIEYKKIEINALLANNDLKQSLQKLDTLSKNDKDNLHVYYNIMGGIYEKLDSITLAVKYYEWSLQLKPDYKESNLRLGGIFYEKSRVLYEKINQMDYATYQKSGKKVENEASLWGKKSLPYLEKAYRISNEPQLAKIIHELSKNMKIPSPIQEN